MDWVKESGSLKISDLINVIVVYSMSFSILFIDYNESDSNVICECMESDDEIEITSIAVSL
jgi:hypothetical protein